MKEEKSKVAQQASKIKQSEVVFYLKIENANNEIIISLKNELLFGYFWLQRTDQ